jgi:hypothetical protein
MKRILQILLIFSSAFGIKAQVPPPYPVAPAAPGNIETLEYFITGNPYFGSGSALTITPQPDINNFSASININALPQGFYRFAVRAKEVNGGWGHTHSLPFSYVVSPVYPTAPQPVTNIVRIEYAIDVLPAFGSATPLSFTPGTDVSNLNAVINISGLAIGPHILYIRSQDANGRWSLTNISFFDNTVSPPYPTAPAPATAISQLEYFIDTDPGFGLATPVTFTSSTNVVVSFDVNGLTAGLHTFYIRSRNNPWGLVTAQEFIVNSTLPVTWLYVQGQMQANGALIKWATATESNTDRFEIEHSVDGIAFASTGTVTAAGNSSGETKYSFLHPLPADGTNYYRIRQIDKDGRFTYSAVIKIFRTAVHNSIMVYPNPAQNFIILKLTEDKPAMLSIFDMNGKIVQQQQLPPGNQQHNISITNLPGGMYQLQVQNADVIRTASFVKQ